jgi:hypothetical protein
LANVGKAPAPELHPPSGLKMLKGDRMIGSAVDLDLRTIDYRFLPPIQGESWWWGVPGIKTPG